MTIEDIIRAIVREEVRAALSEMLASSQPSTHAKSGSPRLLTIGQAADVLAVSSASVRRLVDSGQLPAVKCFTSLRVDPSDIDEFIKQSKHPKKIKQG